MQKTLRVSRRIFTQLEKKKDIKERYAIFKTHVMMFFAQSEEKYRQLAS